MEKMETSSIKHAAVLRALVTSEEDNCCEKALESLDEAPVVAAIRGQSKEGKHLGGSGEMDDRAFLPNCEGCDPDGVQRSQPHSYSQLQEHAARQTAV
jgi:hypothetical protein